MGRSGGVSIDVPNDEHWPTSAQLVVADDSLYDVVGSGSFGGVAVRTAVAIDVVPMTKSSSFALAMGNKLSPAQFDVLGKPLAASIKWEASISGKGNNADASTWLTVGSGAVLCNCRWDFDRNWWANGAMVAVVAQCS